MPSASVGALAVSSMVRASGSGSSLPDRLHSTRIVVRMVHNEPHQPVVINGGREPLPHDAVLLGVGPVPAPFTCFYQAEGHIHREHGVEGGITSARTKVPTGSVPAAESDTAPRAR